MHLVWTYHVVAPRKAMVNPGLTPGALGAVPELRKLSSVRISYVTYPGSTPVEIREEHYALGKTRLMKHWTGKVLFFEHGRVPEKRTEKLSTYKKHGVLGLDGELPYKQDAERSERKYRGARKPNSIDSESWRSMSRVEREGYVESELREAELSAMSKNDPRDAAPVRIEYDEGYESPAFKGDKDGWLHDAKHGVVIRHHPLSRKAKFDPESLKNCPVPTCMLSDTRITLVQTEGAEFALHDSWRKPEHKMLPFHWTGRTIFMLRDHAEPRVKISPSKPGMFQPSELEDEERSYFLRSNSRIVVPAKERSTVETGLRVKPPTGVWGRFRAADKKHATHPSLDVCPGIISEEFATENMSVDVVTSSENDLVIEPGDVVVVVQFYSGIVCVAEVGDVAAPVPENKDTANLACGVITNGVSSSADYPQMPLRNQPYQHRHGDTTVFWYSACVARPVDRKERTINAKAMAAPDKEWNKLIAQKCWDYASVREWKEVAAEADRQGVKAHVGRIFDVCVEKLFRLIAVRRNSISSRGRMPTSSSGSPWSYKDGPFVSAFCLGLLFVSLFFWVPPLWVGNLVTPGVHSGRAVLMDTALPNPQLHNHTLCFGKQGICNVTSCTRVGTTNMGLLSCDCNHSWNRLCSWEGEAANCNCEIFASPDESTRCLDPASGTACSIMPLEALVDLIYKENINGLCDGFDLSPSNPTDFRSAVDGGTFASRWISRLVHSRVAAMYTHGMRVEGHSFDLREKGAPFNDACATQVDFEHAMEVPFLLAPNSKPRKEIEQSLACSVGVCGRCPDSPYEQQPMCEVISSTPARGAPDYCEEGLEPLPDPTPNLACSKQRTGVITPLNVTCNRTSAEVLAHTSPWSDDGHVDGICLIYEIADAASPILAPLLFYSAFATQQGKVTAYVCSCFLAQLRWILRDGELRQCLALWLQKVGSTQWDMQGSSMTWRFLSALMVYVLFCCIVYLLIKAPTDFSSLCSHLQDQASSILPCTSVSALLVAMMLLILAICLRFGAATVVLTPPPDYLPFGVATQRSVCTTPACKVTSFKGCLLLSQECGASWTTYCASLARFFAAAPDFYWCMYCGLLLTCGLLIPAFAFVKAATGFRRHFSRESQHMLRFSKCGCCCAWWLVDCGPLLWRGASTAVAHAALSQYFSQHSAAPVLRWLPAGAVILALARAVSFFKPRNAATRASCIACLLLCTAGLRGCLPFTQEGSGASHAVALSNTGQIVTTPNLQCTLHDLLLICHLIVFSATLSGAVVAMGQWCLGDWNRSAVLSTAAKMLTVYMLSPLFSMIGFKGSLLPSYGKPGASLIAMTNFRCPTPSPRWFFSPFWAIYPICCLISALCILVFSASLFWL